MRRVQALFTPLVRGGVLEVVREVPVTRAWMLDGRDPVELGLAWRDERGQLLVKGPEKQQRFVRRTSS